MPTLPRTYNFEIFSIANPRNPRLVGSCGLPNAPWDLCLCDTLAYVANSDLIADRQCGKTRRHPIVVGSINNGDAFGIAVQDTIALSAAISNCSPSVSPTRPSPYVISSLPLPGEACYGTSRLDGHLAFVGIAAAHVPEQAARD